MSVVQGYLPRPNSSLASHQLGTHYAASVSADRLSHAADFFVVNHPAVLHTLTAIIPVGDLWDPTSAAQAY